MPELLFYKTEFRNGTESYTATFDPDDPTLIDRYLRYETDTLPTPTQQREVLFTRKASRKKTEH